MKSSKYLHSLLNLMMKPVMTRLLRQHHHQHQGGKEEAEEGEGEGENGVDEDEDVDKTPQPTTDGYEHIL